MEEAAESAPTAAANVGYQEKTLMQHLKQAEAVPVTAKGDGQRASQPADDDNAAEEDGGRASRGRILATLLLCLMLPVRAMPVVAPDVAPCPGSSGPPPPHLPCTPSHPSTLPQRQASIALGVLAALYPSEARAHYDTALAAAGLPHASKLAAGDILARWPWLLLLLSTALLLRRFLARPLLLRQMQVYYTAAAVFLAIKVAQWKSKRYPLSEAEDEERWDAVHAANAARVYRIVIRLRGFWIKVGQYMSSRGDIMPAPWIAELSKLQDTVPFQPFADVKRTLEEDLGQPLENVFASFSEKPLASASIAQVSRLGAALCDREPAGAACIQARPFFFVDVLPLGRLFSSLDSLTRFCSPPPNGLKCELISGN